MAPALPLILLLAGAPSAAPVAISPAERAAAKWIDARLIQAHTRFLASDLLEGRGPASRGDRLAQEYLAAQFEALGLLPGSPDGTYYQPFELVGITGNPDRLAFSAGQKRLELRYHEDFIAVSGGQEPESRIDSAELVFVGYGIVAPEYQWDDFKGVDLRGKVLLVMNNDPEDDPALFAGRTRLWYGRWDYKYETAAKQGAAGAIIVHTTPSAGYPWQVVQTSWSGEQFELPHRGGHALQMKGWVTEDAARRLVSFAGKDLDALRAAAQGRSFRPVPLGTSLSVAFKNAVQRKKTANVLGLLPGSDRELSKQLVIYTAHHDHLGRKESARAGEDDIYNGAVDNASGVAAVLSVARAMAALPRAPRRSVLFACVAAEEQGLLGSQYLVEHPPVPVGAMAANINVDGVNIWGKTRDVTVIGLGKSSLDGFVTAIAASQGRVTKPDQLSDRGFFYRSDQFNFARAGVPAAYFGSGMDFLGRPEGWGKRQRELWEAKHYHQPSDELNAEWDLSGAVEDARLYFHLGVQLANAPAMPAWNEGDEFQAARLRALEALEKESSQSGPAVRP
ncbi:MAG: M20/M25/M40 family metallo-hydrolase [Myxococcales bacterium]|nr:M20/M25/M40 family metallo-hydrolase [Myxococcales bacterium]